MKTVFILLDSMNRHLLNCYGAEDPAITPNIDRIARRGVIFDNHWCGSTPCMPARRDIMTGRLNFLERPWGGIEPFDYTLPMALKEKNVYSHIETDHYHYLERGGENYFAHFTSWKFHRGTEWDTINWGPDRTGIPHYTKPEGFCGQYMEPYARTQQVYGGRKENFSTPRTLKSAAEWLEKNREGDNYFLWVEGFDPHEPFDVPQEFIDLYDAGGTAKPEYCWPEYSPTDIYTKEQVDNFRLLYKALLSMSDHYVGKILDVFDRYDLWKDTLLIFTTDHGFMLGEHGFMAKNYMADYNELAHIPLIIAAPGLRPGRCGALTENIDMFPTIAEYFGVGPGAYKNKIHGRNLLPLLYGKCDKVRDTAIYGCFGKTVNMTDGRYTYIRRTTTPTNEPLYIYGADMATSNHFFGFDCMDPADFCRIEMGRFLSWTDYPVYKIPATLVKFAGMVIFNAPPKYIPETMLFDIREDYAQQHPIRDEELEQRCVEKLRQSMQEHDAPLEQYVRLGIL